MKQIVFFLLIICSSPSWVSAQANKTPGKQKTATKTQTPPMKNLLDSFSYAVGVNIGESMKAQNINDFNSSLMIQAIWDVLKNNQPKMPQDVCNRKMQEQIRQFGLKRSAEEKAKGAAFLAKNKERKEVTTLPNGLQYEILRAGGEGSNPAAVDTVVVNYIGTLIDGTEFDRSRGEPITFPLNGVIRGWTEILQLMTKGAKWKVYIPSQLAYGEQPAPGGKIPPGSTLIFEIELLDIKPGVNH